MSKFLTGTKIELRKTFNLAFPIVLGFVGQGLFSLVDVFMVGKILGEREIAAATLANSVYWFLMMFGVGMSMAIPVFVAQLAGRESRETDREASRERVFCGNASILRHGLFLQLALSLLFLVGLILLVKIDIFALLGQPEEVAKIAKPYEIWLAFSLPTAMLFGAIKSYRDATGWQWRGLLWLAIGAVVNVFFNYVLMTGTWIFPNMGLDGAAAGTVISRAISLVGIVLHGGLVLQIRRGIQLKPLWEQFKFGVPCALQGVFEGGFFVITPFFMGWINEASIAANAIAVTISSFVFMIPCGLSQAMSIRVGEAFGAKSWTRIYHIAAGLLAFTIAIMICWGAGTATFNREIATFFNLTPEGIDIASTFIVITAFYALFDGIQCVSSGVMRGMGDVKIISYATFIAYWPGACAIGLFLAFPCGLDGVGIWLGIAFALFALSIFFTARWIFFTRRLSRGNA